MSKPSLLLLLIGLVVLTSCAKTSEKWPSGIEHVIVIGVDGLSPDGIKNANTPVIDSLIAHGAIKRNVRTVLTSSSSQNWASMIMGAGPEQHGVINNDWEIDDHMLPPIVKEADGRFPTIFSMLHREKPDHEIGVVYHWKGFGRLFQKSAVDYDRRFSTEDSTVSDFVRYIKESKPNLGFVHLDHVDHAGHTYGHGSDNYYEAVGKGDALIGKIATALQEAQMEDKTLLIITSDHGGIGFGHGGPTPEEAEIAMIFSGRGIKSGYAVEQEVYTYDLAATIAFALNIQQPYAWIGRPVKAVFAGYEEPENLWKGSQTIAQPVIYPERRLYQQAGGLYVDSQPEIAIETQEGSSITRYTTDGSDPDNSSPLYEKAFTVRETTVVKAKSFNERGDESLVSTAYFRVVGSDKGNGLKTRWYRQSGLKQLPDFSSLTSDSTWISSEFSTDLEMMENLLGQKDGGFALTFEGFIDIDSPGEYVFSTQSDDGSQLFINGQLIVDNDGNHGVLEESGSVDLTMGRHPILVTFYNNGGGFWLDAFYKGPGLVKQIIPADKLFIQ